VNVKSWKQWVMENAVEVQDGFIMEFALPNELKNWNYWALTEDAVIARRKKALFVKTTGNVIPCKQYAVKLWVIFQSKINTREFHIPEKKLDKASRPPGTWLTKEAAIKEFVRLNKEKIRNWQKNISDTEALIKPYEVQLELGELLS